MPLFELGGNLHSIDAAVYVQGVMINPRGTSTEHRAFVEAVRNQATKGVLRKDEPVRANPKMLPFAVAAAMGPHLDDIARNMGRLHITRGRILRAGVASRLFVLVLPLQSCPGHASKETAYEVWERAAQTSVCPTAAVPLLRRFSTIFTQPCISVRRRRSEASCGEASSKPGTVVCSLNSSAARSNYVGWAKRPTRKAGRC